MNELFDRAKVLLEALPYISEFKGMTLVIKCASFALKDKNIEKTIAEDVSLLKAVGFNPILVNGDDSLVKTLILEGVGAVGLSGTNSKEFDKTLLTTLTSNNFVPVIFSTEEEADALAIEVAHALHVEKLIFLTEYQGILENKNDKASLLPRVKIGKIKEMMKLKTVNEKMVPMLNVYIDGINKGVDDIHILSATIPHAIILEVFTDKGVGTLIEG